MNIEASPVVLEKVRLYAEPFRHHPPPVFAHFPGGTDPVFPFAPDSDRGLGIILLVATLHRPDGEASAVRIVAGLYRLHGNDVFRLNRLPFDPLREEIAALAGNVEAGERVRIPGILRSACDFFYRVGPLGAWLSAAPDWENRAGELCNEIYWMGMHSRTRAKARLFFLLACLAPASESGIPSFGARHPQAANFVWPAGEGHMRFWIDILKPGPGAAGHTPEARLDAFARFARAVFPAEPWRLFQPLDAFLRRDGRGSYVCRNTQGGCRPCPLASHCPAAGHFISGEG